MATGNGAAKFLGFPQPQQPERKPMTHNLLFCEGKSDFLTASVADTKPFPKREPLRHLLIGSPHGVQQTIHRLHNLGYTEAGLWSSQLPLPNQELIITPYEGEVLSMLVRYLVL
jgi:hypothetical protein